jgi:hypothetical protein
MSRFGFVYCLWNVSYPGIYKIGCTERSPHARAAELSRATGVPSEFYVSAYIECDGYQAAESDIHRHLAEYRFNKSREFFKAPPVEIACAMYFHPSMLTWADLTFFEDLGQGMHMFDSPYQKPLRRA